MCASTSSTRPSCARWWPTGPTTQVWNLNRGGHDIFKIFTAYKAANEHKGQPTLILAKTIKGFGMGQAGEAMNISHQQKKLDIEARSVASATASACRCPTTSSPSCPT
jgi:deoxyxylulose-5-phosphate synthase